MVIVQAIPDLAIEAAYPHLKSMLTRIEYTTEANKIFLSQEAKIASLVEKLGGQRAISKLESTGRLKPSRKRSRASADLEDKATDCKGAESPTPAKKQRLVNDPDETLVEPSSPPAYSPITPPPKRKCARKAPTPRQQQGFGFNVVAAAFNSKGDRDSAFSEATNSLTLGGYPPATSQAVRVSPAAPEGATNTSPSSPVDIDNLDPDSPIPSIESDDSNVPPPKPSRFSARLRARRERREQRLSRPLRADTSPGVSTPERAVVYLDRRWNRPIDRRRENDFHISVAGWVEGEWWFVREMVRMEFMRKGASAPYLAQCPDLDISQYEIEEEEYLWRYGEFIKKKDGIEVIELSD